MRDTYSYLECYNRVLDVKSTVRRKSLGNDEEGIRICLHTKLSAPFSSFLYGGGEVVCTGNFEGASTGNQSLIFQGVLDATKAVPKSIVNLRDGVLVRTYR